MYHPVPDSGSGSRSPSTRDQLASNHRSRGGRGRAQKAKAVDPTASKPGNPFGARRTHRKVRTGCKKCKERKIKCDEAKPQCWQCKRHNVPCDFDNPSPGEPCKAAAQSPAVSPGASPGASPEDSIMVRVADPSSVATPDHVSSADDSSAAAAFAFLERSLSANKGGFLGGSEGAGEGGGGGRAGGGGTSPGTFTPAVDPALGSTPSPRPLPPAAARRHHAWPPPLACPAAEDDLALNMTDLALLHHFTTSTASDLNPWHAGLQEWWRREVPRVAFHHPFVMRSLLALAGLHVAYLSRQHRRDPRPGATPPGARHENGKNGEAPPATSTSTSSASASSSSTSSEAGVRAFHISRAIEQHKLAGQTASSMLLGLNRDTSAPMYVFSVATLIISLAMPRPASGRVVSWDGSGVVEWLRLMRGTKTIADMGEAWIVEGDMLQGTLNEKVLPRALERAGLSSAWGNGGSSISGSNSNSNSNSSSNSSNINNNGNGHHEFDFGTTKKRRSRWHVMHEPPLDQLREAVAAEPTEASRQLCLEALGGLQRVYASFLDHGESVQTVRLIFSWVCHVDQGYLDSLGRHNAPCLLLFAYFGVLLHWTDRAWWLEGWGPHIIEAVSNILGGSRCEYKEYLSWPREQVGLPALG